MYTLIDTQTFTSNGTWTKPLNTDAVSILLIGGGGGGASGEVGQDGVRKDGGDGGFGALALFLRLLPETDFGSSESVVIGLGGSGGASQTVNNSAGNPGSDGGDTTFSIYKAAGGLGGQASLDEPGGANELKRFFSDTTTEGDTCANFCNHIQTDSVLTDNSFSVYPTGGGNGGAQFAAGGGDQGRRGTDIIRDYLVAEVFGGDAGLQVPPQPGGNGNTGFSYYGTGGGGGAAPDEGGGNGQSGGDGGLYGGGGGGGGATDNGADSGAGGSGANGIAVIFSYRLS